MDLLDYSDSADDDELFPAAGGSVSTEDIGSKRQRADADVHGARQHARWVGTWQDEYVFQGHRHATTPSFSCDQRMHRPKHVLPNPDSLLDADGEGE